MLEKLPHVFGRALKSIRPGVEKTLFHDERLAAVPASISVTSLALLDGGAFDARFTADGAGVSPPLEWRGVPLNAVGVVVLVEDADSPTPRPLVHVIAHHLPGRDGGFAERALSANPPRFPTGRNSYLRTGWLPPDPPTGHGVHRYLFQVYALGADPGFGEHPGRDAVEAAVVKHGIAKGLLTATYQRA